MAKNRPPTTPEPTTRPGRPPRPTPVPKPQGKREPLTWAEAKALTGQAVASGAPKRLLLNAFHKAELAQASEEPPVGRIEHPLWLKALAQKRASPVEVGEELVSRLRREPVTAQVVLSQAIVNELGRAPEGAAVVRAAGRHLVIQTVMNNPLA